MRLKNQHFTNSLASDITKIILGSVLISLMAQISIPIKPIAITFQTVAVIALALIYTPKNSFLSSFLYVIMGVIGLPVFPALSSGVDYLFSVKFGYYFGMLVASYVIPTIRCKFAEKFENFYNLTILILFANIIIYFFGVTYLASYIGISSALYCGFYIFIPSGVIKSVSLAFLYKIFKKNKF